MPTTTIESFVIDTINTTPTVIYTANTVNATEYLIIDMLFTNDADNGKFGAFTLQFNTPSYGIVPLEKLKLVGRKPYRYPAKVLALEELGTIEVFTTDAAAWSNVEWYDPSWIDETGNIYVEFTVVVTTDP